MARRCRRCFWGTAPSLLVLMAGCGRVNFGVPGNGDGGRIGDSTTVDVVGVASPDAPPGCNTVGGTGAALTAISLAGGGANNTCVVLSDQTLWCWGANRFGEVGTGTTTEALAPVQIVLGGPVARVASHGGQGSVLEGHTCATRVDGVPWCWGDNSYGEIGDGTVTGQTACVGTPCDPTPAMPALAGVSVIAGGYSHSCAVRGTDSTVWCWGGNATAQLGLGNTSGSQTCNSSVCETTPQQVGLTSVVDVATGDSHTCAIRSDNTLWCWGADNSAQVGDGTTSPTQRTPIQVLTSVRSVSTGNLHTCAVKQDGTLWCWGNNSDGRIGDGTMTLAKNPTQVTALGNTVISVSAGESITCAVKMDGTMWCWGYAVYGELGPGANSSIVPKQVLGLPGPAAIVSGTTKRVCSLLVDGSVWCWGIGYGSVPTQIGIFCP